MLTDKQLNDAVAYGEWLRLVVHERELPANSRVRAAGACLAIAQEHRDAIVVLLEERLYALRFYASHLRHMSEVSG